MEQIKINKHFNSFAGQHSGTVKSLKEYVANLPDFGHTGDIQLEITINGEYWGGSSNVGKSLLTKAFGIEDGDCDKAAQKVAGSPDLISQAKDYFDNAQGALAVGGVSGAIGSFVTGKALGGKSSKKL